MNTKQKISGILVDRGGKLGLRIDQVRSVFVAPACSRAAVSAVVDSSCFVSCAVLGLLLCRRDPAAKIGNILSCLKACVDEVADGANGAVSGGHDGGQDGGGGGEKPGDMDLNDFLSFGKALIGGLINGDAGGGGPTTVGGYDPKEEQWADDGDDDPLDDTEDKYRRKVSNKKKFIIKPPNSLKIIGGLNDIVSSILKHLCPVDICPRLEPKAEE